MRRIVLCLLVLLTISAVSGFAEDPDMFVKTMPITRIYTHKLGFKVVYLKTDMNFGEFYVPIQWFDATGGKGVMLRGIDPAYPYFSIFWQNGEFHSIKLYVIDHLGDESWAPLPITPETAKHFEIDTLVLEF